MPWAATDRAFLDPAVVARLGTLELKARTIVEGFLSGLHRSPFKGFSVEFAEYRQYIHGDDPLMLYADDRRVFPEAVSRTVEGAAVSRFSVMQRWAAILIFHLIS